MDAKESRATQFRLVLPRLVTLTVGTLLVFLLPRAAQAESAESQPEAIGKERTALYLKGIHAPHKELEADLNQLALASESCRAEHGAKLCGLPEKALASDKLEERYSYYVKGPVEAHFGHGVRVERRHWERPGTPDSK
jgi:hypothetical protein